MDRGLEGNEEYFYKVVVEDMTGARSESEERSGGFHLFIEEWGLGSAPYGMVIDESDNVYVVGLIRIGKVYRPGMALYDLSFRKIYTGMLTIFEEGRVDVAADRKGYVYFAGDLKGGGARLYKLDSVGQSPRLEWARAIEMEGSGLAGIGVAGEDDILVVSRDGDVFAFDADGQELQPLPVARGYSISAMEIWEDVLGLILPRRGKIRTVRLARFGGNYRAMPPIAELGEGVGVKDGQFLSPTNMVKGDMDRLFIVNGGLGRIEVLKNGKYLTKFGRAGEGPGEFVFEFKGVVRGDVALDSAGNVYVVDTGNGRIQKFGP